MAHPVTVYRSRWPVYPNRPPYHPAEKYPEAPFLEIDPQENPVYASVRECLRMASLDGQNFGRPQWNPLGEWVQPGNFVLLKPNLIKEFHPRDPHGWRYVMTHASVIRAVADYVVKALDGRGRLMIADAPQTDSSFQKIVSVLGLDVLQDFYRSHGVGLELVDLRQEEWANRGGVIAERKKLEGDPEGYVAFDLAGQSEFVDHGGEGRYYGADYDEGMVNRHHSRGKHEYLISGSAVKCDVFINLPKLKTHKKTGVTINLKNLVGINGDKNWLPHHTEGFPETGGDQYPKRTAKRMLEMMALKFLRGASLKFPAVGVLLHQKAKIAGKEVFGDTENVLRSGNWHGNATTWRMALDLNKVLLFGNADGSLRPAGEGGRKRCISFVDGFIAGQGSGPMNPDPAEVGLILFGANPACVDAVATVLMGFDPEKIPLVSHAFRSRGWPLARGRWQDVPCVSNVAAWNAHLEEIIQSGSTLHFEPHFGWKSYIEL